MGLHVLIVCTFLVHQLFIWFVHEWVAICHLLVHTAASVEYFSCSSIISWEALQDSWYCQNIFSYCKILLHSFIPLPCADCDDSLPFSGASSIPLLPPFSANYFSILSHLILPSISWSNSQSCYSQFIYNTVLGILFCSILCTCPNQRNLFNLIVSTIVGCLV